MVLRKSFYIHWSAGRSPRAREVNPGRGPLTKYKNNKMHAWSIIGKTLHTL